MEGGRKRAVKYSIYKANEALLEVLLDLPRSVLPKNVHPASMALRLRQKLRHIDPKNVKFELEKEHIPMTSSLLISRLVS